MSSFSHSSTALGWNGGEASMAVDLARSMLIISRRLEVLSFLLLCLGFGGVDSTSRSSELDTLLDIKVTLDPGGHVLHSWVAWSIPCEGSFRGVVCNGAGKVANVSLQGAGLTGSIPAALAELDALTGLYLHFNELTGSIPPVLGSLIHLTDLYLNVNRLMGHIPPELGSLVNLQVLHLCCNSLMGIIPAELGRLGNLSVLSLQHNNLTGSIPFAFGSLVSLTRLDLSFNMLSGSIPSSLVKLTKLISLDMRNNNLSDVTPAVLRLLQQHGFAYANNSLLCGEYLSDFRSCNSSVAFRRQEPLVANPPIIDPHSIRPPPIIDPHSIRPPISTAAESASRDVHTGSHSKSSRVGIVSVMAPLALGGVLVGLLTFIVFRRHKQRIGSANELSTKASGNILSEKLFGGDDPFLKCTSPSNDYIYPTRSSRSLGSFSGTGIFSKPSYCTHYDLDELETATNYFSEQNLLGKNCYSAVHKGTLKDGSAVAIRSLSKASCKVDLEVLVGMFAQMKHENVVALKGFCTSTGKTEWFLVYDFVSNGTLQDHLYNRTEYLDWPVRIGVASGIAKGLHFMHSGTEDAIIHQSLSTANVLLDRSYGALLSDGGLHRLLADDIVFSKLKVSALLGYLAPEYATTGRLEQKGDVYAFGVILLQLISGKMPTYLHVSQSHPQAPDNMVSWARSLIQAGRIDQLMDERMGNKYSYPVALRMAAVAFSCTAENASKRPCMAEVVDLLNKVDGEGELSSGGGEEASSPSSCTSEDLARMGQQQALLCGHRRVDAGRVE
eukprot:c30032_g1_i1 orf=8-2350(+)